MEAHAKILRPVICCPPYIYTVRTWETPSRMRKRPMRLKSTVALNLSSLAYFCAALGWACIFSTHMVHAGTPVPVPAPIPGGPSKLVPVEPKRDLPKVDPKAVSPKPVAPNVVETKLTDIKPADVKSGDVKSGDVKPAEVKPSDTKLKTKTVPENLEDLKVLEAAVQKVVAKGLPATVSIRIGQSFGSGVIVSKDGYVLTAGHVVGEPDRDVEFIFPNGKRVKGKTLGANHDIDSGLMKITEPGEWPFVEMGKSADLKLGDWVVVAGHPGGYKSGRPPVVRFGKIISNSKTTIWSDAPIVGGDSGGPMFDLDGKVIAIHSRISGPLTENYHVPIDTFQTTWERLAKGEEWGDLRPRRGGPFLGATVEPHEKGCRITDMPSDSPAAKADLKIDDVIVKFEGKNVRNLDELQQALLKKKPGNEVILDILRGDEKLEKKVVLGKRP